MSDATAYWSAHAFVGGAWRERVELRVGIDGLWTSIRAGIDRAPDATDVGGPVVPSLVDAHSHAFQRAMAGLTERGGPAGDDFWSWRAVMYKFVTAPEPEQIAAIAAQLYVDC